MSAPRPWASRVSCESARSERYTAIERLGFELLLERPALEPRSECPRKNQGLNTFGRALTPSLRAKTHNALYLLVAFSDSLNACRGPVPVASTRCDVGAHAAFPRFSQEWHCILPSREMILRAV